MTRAELIARGQELIALADVPFSGHPTAEEYREFHGIIGQLTSGRSVSSSPAPGSGAAPSPNPGPASPLENCWICGKPKGQPPDRCNGHYEEVL